MFKFLALFSLLVSVTANKKVPKVPKVQNYRQKMIETFGNKQVQAKKDLISAQSLAGSFPSNPVYGYSKTFVLDSDNTCSDVYTVSEAFILDTCLVGGEGYVKYSCKNKLLSN